MNTHGHQSVAETAGLPLLQEAFGADKHSLNALYLGNWLTDVSQAVDPVAYWVFAGRAGGAIAAITDIRDDIIRDMERLIAELTPTLFSWMPVQQALDPLKGILENSLNPAIRGLRNLIDGYLILSADERNPRLARFFRKAFLVIGYFKFVHPNIAGQAPRMDFESFMQVFGREDTVHGAIGVMPSPGSPGVSLPAPDTPGSYTQYYPHEHLDRPECLPPRDPPVFAPGVQIVGPPNPTGPGRRPGTRWNGEVIRPDLYSYLRDQIEMTAGLLSEVDTDFEAALLNGIRDDDPNWHKTLAKLGHALHQVEDFFAHSNWVELAHKSLGPDFLDRVIPPHLPIDFLNRAYTVYQKRLSRHLTSPLTNWQDHPDEDWVVTGSFDFRDTLISLAHVTEEIWGGHVPDPYARGHDLFQSVSHAIQHPETVVFKAQKAMRETLEFLDKPTRALEDRDNDIAQRLRRRFEPRLVRLARPRVSARVARAVLREMDFLRDSPVVIQRAFFDVITEGSRIFEIGRTSYSIYHIIRELREFFANPYAWMLDFLERHSRQLVIDAIKFYAKERIYDWIAADRIGCHSLLAKDNGLEPFYEQQKECATAVHWYIVKTLLRTRSDENRFIDWLELLEYFLRNPLPSGDGANIVYRTIPVTIVHVTGDHENIESLVSRYAPSAIRGRQLGGADIADANFGFSSYGRVPQRQREQAIIQILNDPAWGRVSREVMGPVFRSGLRVLIPNQRIRARFTMRRGDETPWFKAVLQSEEGWKVFRGYDDPETGISVPPLEHHRPRYITVEEFTSRIRRGRNLRQRSREAYRPGEQRRRPFYCHER